MAKGYIYIMTNPCLKGMVKIGYAKNVESRRKQLSTTALPTDYEIYATYETQGNLRNYINLLIILIRIYVFQKVENSLLWNQKKHMNCWSL